MKVFLEGLNCANCAGKIEKLVGKMPNVSAASISLATGSLVIEEADGFAREETYDAIVKLVHSLEPHVVVSTTRNQTAAVTGCGCGDHAHGHSHEHAHDHPKTEAVQSHTHGDMDKRQKIELSSAIGLFILGFILQALLPANLEMVTIGVFLGAYLLAGYRVILLAFRNIGHGQIFDENFLMAIATFGALFLTEWPEAAGVMIFFGIGEYFQDRAVDNARRSIAETISFNAITANRVDPEGEVVIDAKEVKIGDLLIIKPGEKIPADGIIIEGVSHLDTSPLTGESYPRKVAKGDEILSGMINGNAVLKIRVTKDYENSTAMKIMHLIEEASDKKGKTEKFITKFSHYYTPIVVFSAIAMAIIPPLFISGASWQTWFYQSLIFLVVSCPCALVLSIPISYFGGIGRASKEGVLIKGGNYLDVLYQSDVFVFDKTGTLTQGEFKVLKAEPAPGFTEAELLAAAATGEHYSNHPIGKAITTYVKMAVDENNLTDYLEVPGKGTRVVVGDQVILAGNRSLFQEHQIELADNQETGTIVYVAVDNKLAGYLVLGDMLKENAFSALTLLKKLGIKKTIMLSGDNSSVANEIGTQLMLDEVIGDCLPQDKVRAFEKIKGGNTAGKTIFVGDGMNDAPVLAMADAGIAMGALGSDAAIEAADIILMKDDPMDIVKAVNIAKYTRRIMIQNIVMALGIKLTVLTMTFFGMGEMYLAIFADVGAAILTILNTTRILRYRGFWQKQNRSKQLVERIAD
ncbi:heavy metal translocating P-type ATPase [Acetobacterium woodii]|uniref:Cd(2+)-exporting ATPase n=1 Tax=Acetobacterium woodii (strain ATCC 29683 / DSM 1030 / JCM 2381 / KCTC 1655 / WB1) TaxID=931626 RepID=H6LB80_ACEWD|nr:heavy metal translocating P-type ATPase [Acetobacterium woodii]AFA47632.1 heavy metal-(Cd/Co/Hg/Pb/Zn)-translocating ATPase P-type [Acetobacterium woodii DSM 1030]